jgi:hypothetical protein
MAAQGAPGRTNEDEVQEVMALLQQIQQLGGDLSNMPPELAVGCSRVAA